MHCLNSPIHNSNFHLIAFVFADKMRTCNRYKVQGDWVELSNTWETSFTAPKQNYQKDVHNVIEQTRLRHNSVIYLTLQFLSLLLKIVSCSFFFFVFLFQRSTLITRISYLCGVFVLLGARRVYSNSIFLLAVVPNPKGRSNYHNFGAWPFKKHVFV